MTVASRFAEATLLSARLLVPTLLITVALALVWFAGSRAVAQDPEAETPPSRQDEPRQGDASRGAKPPAPSLSTVIRQRPGIGRDGLFNRRRLQVPELPTGSGPKRTEGASTSGLEYSWRDGDRTRKVYLQRDLVVVREDAVAVEDRERAVGRTGSGLIVREPSHDGALSAAGASTVSGDSRSQPVFRSSTGTLMTLPGGVVLILDAGLTELQVQAFFAANGIDRSRVSPLGSLPNAFVVATDPGFASLELANSLADMDGVDVSSPNWWQELSIR